VAEGDHCQEEALTHSLILYAPHWQHNTLAAPDIKLWPAQQPSDTL
jgi:hypothetical protein